MTRTLVLGGARSGKSVHAERMALDSGKEIVYIATAKAGDSEMAARIAHHRTNRPAAWRTVEEPLMLGDALSQWNSPERMIVVDCLTLWLLNLLLAGSGEFPEVGELVLPAAFHAERDAFLKVLTQAQGDIVLVSNEVGMGVVPQGALSRCFTDEAGRLNQAVAAICDRVVLVAAGLPLMLKGSAC
jgi:adenosylcobinamide kinase/adenosylcobinamide-phosphate guanylyltransferase